MRSNRWASVRSSCKSWIWGWSWGLRWWSGKAWWSSQCPKVPWSLSLPAQWNPLTFEGISSFYPTTMNGLSRAMLSFISLKGRKYPLFTEHSPLNLSWPLSLFLIRLGIRMIFIYWQREITIQSMTGLCSRPGKYGSIKRTFSEKLEGPTFTFFVKLKKKGTVPMSATWPLLWMITPPWNGDWSELWEF